MEKKTKSTNFRLSEDAVQTLIDEAGRTGKSYTQIIEDMLAWRRLFSDEGEAAVNILSRRHRRQAAF